MLKIAKERLNDLYAKINETMGLFIPIKRAGEVNYAVWSEGKEVSLETLKTVKSPKNAFFPQTENMMKFKTEGKNIEVIDVREALSEKIEAMFSSYYEFDSHDQACWFNSEQEKADKEIMLDLITQLISRLNEINDGSFVIEDLETERLKQL